MGEEDHAHDDYEWIRYRPHRVPSRTTLQRSIWQRWHVVSVAWGDPAGDWSPDGRRGVGFD